MDNLKEFKELIERYESITIEEIKPYLRSIDEMYLIAGRLTGFGSSDTCVLCKSVDLECDICIWALKTDATCSCENNEETYCDILDACQPDDLLLAFKARAKYMKSVLKSK